MAKKKGNASAPAPAPQEKPATLKDLLSPEVARKLKEQADEMKAAEEKRKLEERERREAERKAEEKRLENDFEYLLNNSKDWSKYR
ncbi:YqkE family protein [Paenibacillus hamazuiensis]|uniref:YqkE family protein n=1 Tax=Paenibacillus hamazuiensis TaxID=2936508 RepID=UPI00200D8B13|nr:YqkE family protein [Paenibacillus hamazuiensis]